jgi:hypothetical protein
MVGYGAAQVMVFFLPQTLQNVYGLGPFMAGLCVVPFALPWCWRLVWRILSPAGSPGETFWPSGSFTVIGNLRFRLAGVTGRPVPRRRTFAYFLATAKAR